MSAKGKLLELADSDRQHAEMFKEVYQKISGQDYEGPIYQPNLDSPYQIALRQMISNENHAFQEYHNPIFAKPKSRSQKYLLSGGR